MSSVFNWNESGQSLMSPVLAGRSENAESIQQKIFAAARRAYEENGGARAALYRTVYEESIRPFFAARDVKEITSVVFGDDGCAAKYIELVPALLRYAKNDDSSISASRRESSESHLAKCAESVLGNGFGNAVVKSVHTLTLADQLVAKILESYEIPATDRRELSGIGVMVLAWSWAALSLVIANQHQVELSEDQRRFLCQHLFGVPKERYIAVRLFDKRFNPAKEPPRVEMTNEDVSKNPLLLDLRDLSK